MNSLKINFIKIFKYSLPFMIWSLFCFFILHYSNLDLREIEMIHGDSTRVFDPGGIYVDGWKSADFEPFSGGRLGYYQIIIAILVYGSILIIGSKIFELLFKAHNSSLTIQLGTSYLLGYPVLVIINRILSLIQEPYVASILSLLILINTSIAILFIYFYSCKINKIKFSDKLRKVVKPFLIVAAVYIAISIYCIQSGRNYMVSDSILLFLNAANGDYEINKYIPIFGRQSDEFFINLIGIYGAPENDTFIIWFWLSNSFAKASLLFGIYFIISKLTIYHKSISAFMGIGLVLFTTPLANPFWYASLFGGQNPVIFLGHAGRIIGLLLPIFIYYYIIYCKYSYFSLFYILILGACIAGSSVHNIIYSYLVFGLILTSKIFNYNFKNIYISDSIIFSLGLAAIFMPLVSALFISYSPAPGLFGIPLIFGFLMACLMFILRKNDIDKNIEFNHLNEYRYRIFLPILFWSIGIILGMIVMGNIFINSLSTVGVYKFLSKYLPAFGESPWFSGISFSIKPFIMSSCNVPSVYCRDFKGFLGLFGVTIFIYVLMWVITFFSRLEDRIVRSRDLSMITILIAFLNIGFFLSGYLGAEDQGTHWIQTRFIEPSYYLGLILFCIIIVNHLDALTKKSTLIIISIWIIIPIFSHYFFNQLYTNFKYIFNYKPYSNKRVFFNSGSFGINYLINGWSTPEAWGVWSNGKYASLMVNMPINEENLNYNIKFIASGFVVKENNFQISAFVYINNFYVGSLLFNQPGTSEKNIIINNTIIKNSLDENGKLKIDFVLSNTINPSKYGISNDNRELGFGLTSIEISLINNIIE